MSEETADGKGGGRRRTVSGALALATVGAALALAAPGVASRLGDRGPARPGPAPQENEKKGFGDVPLYFEANQGQSDAQVKFLTRAKGYSLFLTADKAVIALPGDGEDRPGAAVHMNLLGSDPAAKVAGASPLAGKVNYLNSADPAQRHTNIATFAKVAYTGVYPGIDLAYYAKGSQLEYDFLVAPGADPSAIRLGIEGTDALRLDEAGNLIMATAAGEVTQHKPVLYQDVDGARVPVEGSFALTDNQVGFAVGAYDARRPLVIDPTLAYSSFLDGSGQRVKVDAEGNAYIAGRAFDGDFPTTPGALRSSATFNEFGVPMAYVTKLNPSGSAVIYSTLIATMAGEAVDLALAPDGSAWVSGSNRFFLDVPVTPGAFLTDRPASTGAFLVKLTPDGSAVSYGTYFANPSTGRLAAEGLALDPSGDIWVTASVADLPSDPPFPTTPGAVRPTCIDDFGSCQGLLLARIHPGGNGLADLTYATWLGGQGMTGRPALGTDGNVYVAGGVNGTLETTPNALHPEQLGGGSDGFLIKVRPAGNGPSDLLYSSYLGGVDQDTVSGSNIDMALGSDNTAYLAYTSFSVDIPITSGAYQAFPRDLANVVLQRIDTNQAGAAGLLYSTYVAADSGDTAFGIAVDGRGHMFVVGRASFNFPVRNPLACCAINKGPNPFPEDRSGDVYVLELNPAGQGDADLVFSTFLGGADIIEGVEDIALGIDSAGRARVAFVVGIAPSSDFPITPGAYNTSTGLGWISKIDFSDQIPCTRTLTGNTPGPVTVGFGEVVCLDNASVTNGIVVLGGGEARIQNSRVAGSITSTDAAAFTLCATAATGSLTVTGTSPMFVRTGGEGCGPNRILGSPSGSTTTTLATTTSTTLATTTTTLATTTTTTQPTTTTTVVDNSCTQSVQAQRQAFNAAIDAHEVGQSPAVIAAMESIRAQHNAAYDQQLAACTG